MTITGYENLSLTQLHNLFSSENWSSLSFENRINACQEVENRYAAEYNVEPCTITLKEMDGATYGWQSGKTICLNTSLVRDGCFNATYEAEDGSSQRVQIPALAPSWNTLDTVYHEGTHGIQEATGKMPSTYISSDMDSDLYRIQGIEKEAYAVANSRTLTALNDVETSSGELDKTRGEYFASVRNDSFEAALQDAAKHYNDPDIESTLQDVISDRDNGCIRNNPSNSYQSINALCNDNYVQRSATIENAGKDFEPINDTENPQIAKSTYDNTTLTEGIITVEESSAINDGIDDTPSLSTTQSNILDDGLTDSSIDLSSGISTHSDIGMSDGM